MRSDGERREISRRRSRISGLRAGGDDPWRLRLLQGISCRALSARIPDPAHRPDQPAAHSELYRREGAGPAEVVLRVTFEVIEVVNFEPSFRGASKMRTRNLEIPRCAIAHLRYGPSDHTGITKLNEVLLS